MVLFEGGKPSPARPSYKNSINMKISMAHRRNDIDKKKTEVQLTIRIENSVSNSYFVCPKEIYTNPEIH